MNKHIIFFAIGCLFTGFGNMAVAQYNSCKGMNRVDDIKKARHRVETMKMEGTIESADEAPVNYQEVLSGDTQFKLDSYDIEAENQRLRENQGQTVQKTTYEVDEDQFGNASGNEYDLAVDGAFKGQVITILQLYNGFNFSVPQKALAEKGFKVIHYSGTAPSAEELKTVLDESCQLWVISDASRKLNEDHLAVIKSFFDEGRGLYIWGDNTPYYADANFLLGNLFNLKMEGNTSGQHTVPLREGQAKSGLTPGHPISTGIEYVYEGHTIATLDKSPDFEPLIMGSAGNLVTAFYEKEGKRCLVDGGFTRLYVNWDAAGSGRYVKNAAAWLVNYERFGDEVLGKN